MPEKSAELKVADPDPTHVGRNIVTLDRETKRHLGITSGDIVEIEGTKKTAAIVWPARADDEGKLLIRMDSFIRHNAGVGLGEKVNVKKLIPKEAKKVVLAPTQEIRIIASGYDRILKKNFLGRPLSIGDSVWISVFGSGFVYRVIDTNPRGTVKVTDFTQITLKEKPVKGELEAVPTVSYDDIGGLDEPVRKVREMVELPMRHLEIFRKLGIVPPKGVLLFGPPGTGKTLLAKAVASETQAHFKAVNAPEIMCVDGKTPILTNPAGTQTAEQLFAEGKSQGRIINDGRLKIIELQKPLNVFGLNNKMKISKGKITHITKLKAKTFRIKTGLNEEFIISANQPFALMDSFGNIVWKTADQLKKNDLIAIAKALPEGKPFKFPTHSFSNFPKESSEELLHLLGLMYSEGCLEKDGICFANTEETLKECFVNLCKKLFGLNAKKKNEKVLCYSRPLRKYFVDVLGFPVGRKGDFALPKWLFSLSKEETAAFLKGFWEGDGTTSKGAGGYPTIRIYAVGRMVLKDLSVLLRKLSILSKIEPWHTAYGEMFALTLAGNRSRELFAEQITSSAKKYAPIVKWYNSRKKKGDDFPLPNISPLLKQIKSKKKLIYGRTLPEGPTERYISGRDHLTQRKLLEINKYLKDKSLARIASSDLAWSKVREVKQSGEKELFDFTVEPFNNFLAGHTLAVMHNSKFVGEAEERIRQIFKEAEENAPSIIFFDEIDAIAPKREEVIGEVERRVVAQILALMDGLEARGNVIVIAATNRVNSLDEALRRPGRFDREIEFPVPNKISRKEILQIHTRGMPLAKDVDLDFFAGITHGFVGADLAALGKEAGMKALRRYLPKINLEDETIPQEILESMEVNKRDFQNGLKDVQPSALREVTIEVPNVKWGDIGDLEEAKEDLKQAVEWPLKHPDSFKKMGIRPPAGVLLFGPPGCGKTLLAKAVASESEANFISVKGPELLSMWVGQSEKGIRKVFRKARQVAPCIVFFDEIDSIASRRGMGSDSHVTERVVNQLLTELDGIEQNRGVIFMAATNRPDLMDPALLRPGRIDKLVKIDAPDEAGRKAIFKVHTKSVKLAKEVSLDYLVKNTEGFSGADIEGLIRSAALIALKENKMKAGPVSKNHFESVLEKLKPTVTPKLEKAYDEFEEHHAEFRPSYVG
jgi:SpoVK/Ycf46/Vps4 family AAA+-type ATPase